MVAIIKLNKNPEGPFHAMPYVVNVYEWDAHYESQKLVAQAYASTSLLASIIANAFSAPVEVEV